MHLLGSIVIGIIAGWLAERMSGREHGLLTNLVVGVVGSMIGGLLFTSFLGFRYDQGFNLASLAVATAGAIILLAVFGGWRRSIR